MREAFDGRSSGGKSVMAGEPKLHLRALTTQGLIVLGLGLAFLYLRTGMTNPLFEVVGIVAAVVLSGSALALAAITEWVLVYRSEASDPRRAVFYTLAGVLLATAALLLFYISDLSMQILLVVAAVQAAAAGFWNLFFVRSHLTGRVGRIGADVFGVVSLLFGGLLVYATRMDDRDAIGLLGLYLLVEGVKLMFFGWQTGHAGLPVGQKR